MIVFFDIDGTLITEDNRQFLPQSTVTAIKQLRQNGHYALINTGRTRFNVIHQPYIQAIGFDGFVCACGSHILIGKDTDHLEDLLCVTAPDECHAVIVEAARRFHMELMMEGPDAFYFDQSLPMCPQRYGLFTRRPSCSHSVDESHKVFHKFVTWDTAASDQESFIKAVSPWFVHIDRGHGFREYCLKEYSKATGIARIAAYYQQSMEDCIAIGDSMNDLPMLDAVKHSVLMGNGTPSLRSHVEYVTKDILEDGIAHALAHYHLIS